MERNKSRDKEVDILLSVLEGNETLPETIDSDDLTTDVIDFLNFFNVKPGQNEIKIASFYEHYLNWSESPCDYQVFIKLVGKVIPLHVKSKRTLISIKNDLIDLNNNVIKTKRAKKHLSKGNTHRRHIEAFIEDMNLVDSPIWVKLDEIYSWYEKWRYNRKSIKLNKKIFRSILKFYFQAKIGKQRAFFKLKGDFNMERINQLRNSKNEKKEQTVQNQICGPETRIEPKDKT